MWWTGRSRGLLGSVDGWRSGPQLDGHRLDAGEEGDGDALDGPDDRGAGVALHELGEHGAQLEAGEGGAEAEVGSGPEGKVGVGLAGDVEGERVGEHLFVAVGRGVVDDDLVAGRDLCAAELDVFGGGAAKVV